MFKGCVGLKQLQLDNFSVENIETLYEIFECCHNLTNLDISSWDLKNVEEYTDFLNPQITGWPSFISNNVALSQIKTPVNLKVEVKLPEGNWVDETGKHYTAFPIGESSSILLKNSSKPQYEWEK